MTIVNKNTILHVLCETCADECRKSGKFNINKDSTFIECFEDCEKCKVRKGFYYSMEKRTVNNNG